jgi:hypothetical protein
VHGLGFGCLQGKQLSGVVRSGQVKSFFQHKQVGRRFLNENGIGLAKKI